MPRKAAGLYFVEESLHIKGVLWGCIVFADIIIIIIDFGLEVSVVLVFCGLTKVVIIILFSYINLLK